MDELSPLTHFWIGTLQAVSIIAVSWKKQGIMQLTKTYWQWCHKTSGGRWPSELERWTGDRVVQGSNPAVATYSLRNFGNSVYPAFKAALCQCLSEETLKAVGPFYLVSILGEVKDPTSLHWKCVACRGPPNPLLDTSSWTTLEISLKTFVCYPVNMMCSKSNQIKTTLVSWRQNVTLEKNLINIAIR